MALKLLPSRSDEGGYTLLETLISLVIFGSVLLPLSGMVAALMTDQRPKQLQNAFDEARVELCVPLMQESGATPVVRMARGLLIRREVRRNGIFADVKVTVSSASDPEKIVLIMHRTLIAPSPAEEFFENGGLRP